MSNLRIGARAFAVGAFGVMLLGGGELGEEVVIELQRCGACTRVGA